MLYTKAFWLSVAERTGFTFVEALLGYLLVVGIARVESIDWLAGLSISATAAVIALLKGILVARVTDGGPSATNTEAVKPSV